MAKEAEEKNTSMLVKFNENKIKNAKKGLQDIHPRVVVMRRRNILDLYICRIRDCFVKSRSYPVDASTGKKTNLCFQRRKRKDVTVKAFVNVNTLAQRLQQYMKINSIHDARHRNVFKGNFETVATEDLFAFENSNSTDALDLSLQSWITVFHSWNVTPDIPLIRQYIDAYPDHGMRPLRSHTETVYNAEQVKKALKTQKKLKKYLKYWRD